MRGNYVAAATSILVAMLFDIMDGRVARMTHSESKFGMEYDSLSDLISFGLAPAMLIYSWILPQSGRVGWLSAFVFAICGALRLARFNVAENHDPKFFTGLPIPAGAFIISTWYLFCNHMGYQGKIIEIISLLFLYILAFLMVSNVKYPCFKKADKNHKIHFNLLVSLILMLVLIVLEPQISLFSVALVYFFSGLVIFVKRMRKNKSIVHID